MKILALDLDLTHDDQTIRDYMDEICCLTYLCHEFLDQFLLINDFIVQQRLQHLVHLVRPEE